MSFSALLSHRASVPQLHFEMELFIMILLCSAKSYNVLYFCIAARNLLINIPVSEQLCV